MQIIYNELSASPLSTNCVLADEKLARFIGAYSEAREKGFKRIRFSRQLHEIELAVGYTMQHWLSQTRQRNLKDILLGAFTYPFIDDNDEREQEEYVKYHYYFEDAPHGIVKTECDGLAAAHIYDTLSISFSGYTVWENNLLSVTQVSDEDNAEIGFGVANVFSQECFATQLIHDYIESICDILLVETNLAPDEKRIHVRDDHGTAILTSFANRLLKSPYVTAVINSIPFNPHVTRFIRKAYPDGKIEIVLYRDDRGLGMVIQTTGRNMRETQRIAEILETLYNN